MKLEKVGADGLEPRIDQRIARIDQHGHVPIRPFAILASTLASAVVRWRGLFVKKTSPT